MFIKLKWRKFNVEVREAEGRVFGIQAGAPVSITGGKVSVNTGNAEGGSAIYGWGDITIADALVSVTAKGNGIHAPQGSVNIDCADTETNVTVSFQEYAVYGKNQINISEKLEIKIPENGIITQAQTEEGETYTYISTEDGTLAGEAVIASVENTGDEEPDDEEPGDMEEPDDMETSEDMETPDDMENADTEEESEEMKESGSGENNMSVKTGDNTPIAVLVLTSIVSFAIIIITARKKLKCNS